MTYYFNQRVISGKQRVAYVSDARRAYSCCFWDKEFNLRIPKHSDLHLTSESVHSDNY